MIYLDDHVSHLLHASEEMLNALTRLISDFENLRDEIEKLPPCDQRNYLLKESKDFVFHINIYQNVSKYLIQCSKFVALNYKLI